MEKMQLCPGLLGGFCCKLYIPTIFIDVTVFFNKSTTISIRTLNEVRVTFGR